MQAADGVILVENEALTATCRRLLNISRPSYTDLNLVAARALACVVLPAQWRSEVLKPHQIRFSLSLPS